MKRVYWDLLQYIAASVVCGALLGGALAQPSEITEAKKKKHKRDRAMPAYTMEDRE